MNSGVLLILSTVIFSITSTNISHIFIIIIVIIIIVEVHLCLATQTAYRLCRCYVLLCILRILVKKFQDVLQNFLLLPFVLSQALLVV